MAKQNVNYEKSMEQAVPVKIIMDALQNLDVEYLKEAYKQMKDNHEILQSAAILSPFTHKEKQDLNKIKLEQMELIIKLAENVNKIKECEVNLLAAKANEKKMERIFGM